MCSQLVRATLRFAGHLEANRFGVLPGHVTVDAIAFYHRILQRFSTVLDGCMATDTIFRIGTQTLCWSLMHAMAS